MSALEFIVVVVEAEPDALVRVPVGVGRIVFMVMVMVMLMLDNDLIALTSKSYSLAWPRRVLLSSGIVIMLRSLLWPVLRLRLVMAIRLLIMLLVLMLLVLMLWVMIDRAGRKLFVMSLWLIVSSIGIIVVTILSLLVFPSVAKNGVRETGSKRIIIFTAKKAASIGSHVQVDQGLVD